MDADALGPCVTTLPVANILTMYDTQLCNVSNDLYHDFRDVVENENVFLSPPWYIELVDNYIYVLAAHIYKGRLNNTRPTTFSILSAYDLQLKHRLLLCIEYA